MNKIRVVRTSAIAAVLAAAAFLSAPVGATAASTPAVASAPASCQGGVGWQQPCQ